MTISIQLKAQAAAKEAAGRYTLQEAAQEIADNTGERIEPLLSKLERAALDTSLPMYHPGGEQRYEYGASIEGGQASRVREFYEEAYWGDLNAWLADNEKRIVWRFPVPAQATKQADTGLTDDAATANDGDLNAGGADGAREKGRRPPFQQPFQEDEILRVLRAKGYTPTALPRNKPGKPGVKAEVRQALSFGVTIFDKAWERLRATGEIADAE